MTKDFAASVPPRERLPFIQVTPGFGPGYPLRPRRLSAEKAESLARIVLAAAFFVMGCAFVLALQAMAGLDLAYAVAARV